MIVKVYSDIYVPNAFTPNGDGKNDIFYVSGGPHGSMIKNFSIFNRWGQIVFDVHDVLPGDVSSGWNGTFRGIPSIVGNYVYMITLTLAGGEQQIYNGAVMLLR